MATLRQQALKLKKLFPKATIFMSKKQWRKWKKSLLDGTFKQGINILYNPRSKRFCCLGVLEYCLTNGEVEVYPGGRDYMEVPTLSFLRNNGVYFLSRTNGAAVTPYLPSIGQDAATANDSGHYNFAQLAEILEKHVAFTD